MAWKDECYKSPLSLVSVHVLIHYNSNVLFSFCILIMQFNKNYKLLKWCNETHLRPICPFPRSFVDLISESDPVTTINIGSSVFLVVGKKYRWKMRVSPLMYIAFLTAFLMYLLIAWNYFVFFRIFHSKKKKTYPQWKLAPPYCVYWPNLLPSWDTRYGQLWMPS